MSKKTGSKERVIQFASDAGVSINLEEMPASTRTAQEAAAACNCDVEQIVKSLIFEGSDTGELYLLLVSGINQVDLGLATKTVGEPLQRANPKDIRSQTGFAIGGVAPFGSLKQLPTWIDRHLLSLPSVWAAGGAPNAVFNIETKALIAMTNASPIAMTSE